MAAGSTYTPIATTTLGSAGTITFSSIPSTYTDLILVISGTAASNSDLDIRFNSDTGTNYSYTTLYGDGTTAGSSRNSSINYMRMDYYGYVGTTAGQITIIHIMNYANTTTYKTALSRASNANNGVAANVGLWRSTSAINSVSTVTTLATGSTATLYGVKAA